MKIISRFRGEYRFLSNFYTSPIMYEGEEYKNVETAYQERKTLDKSRRAIIRESRTASEAARLGRAKETVLQPGWLEDLKGEVMRDLVWEKFRQNPDLLQKLLDTDDAILIEGNYWHDNYFGVCNCRDCHLKDEQQNVLGTILMDIRSSYQETTI